jgi:hypothetical protein
MRGETKLFEDGNERLRKSPRFEDGAILLTIHQVMTTYGNDD